MRIGVSALYRSNGGSLVNLVQLMTQWQSSGALRNHELVLYVSPWTASGLARMMPSLVAAEVRLVVLSRKDQGLAGRLWYEQIILPRQLTRDGIDVLFCPANVIPFASRVPCVVTFQNAAPFCASITPGTVGMGLWLSMQLLGVLIGLSAWRATRIIFISSYFERQVHARFRHSLFKGCVIPRAAEVPDDNPEAAMPAGRAPPYLLMISHIWPYKNVLELVEGFITACASTPAPFTLLLAGRFFVPAYERRVRDKLAELDPAGERVVLLGHVGHAETHALLEHAEGFVFSSTCENCPTVLVEALRAGSAIACSNVSVMPEIAGEAALYFDPDSPASIAGVLTRLMGDALLREHLRARARARAAEFPDPRTVAERTLAVLEAACAPGSG